MADQPPAGDDGAEAGAQGVDEIEPPDIDRRALDRVDHGARQKRQGQAHQEGRDDQSREGEDESEQAGFGERDEASEQHVVKQPGRQDGIGGDAEFAKREGDQGTAPVEPVGELAGRKAADADAEQEGADDDGGGQAVGAAEQAEQAMPGRLIDERARARQQKDEVEDQVARTTGHGPCSARAANPWRAPCIRRSPC